MANGIMELMKKDNLLMKLLVIVLAVTAAFLFYKLNQVLATINECRDDAKVFSNDETKQAVYFKNCLLMEDLYK